MKNNRRLAIAALVAAGLLWGTTVPLSKLALGWLPPGWLTVARFGLAAAVLLAVARGRGLRRAFTPRVLVAGALGYGGSVMVQNVGITRTSVTHAALLIGAVPVLIAIIAAVWHRVVARPVAWAGFVVSLAGVGLVTAGGGGGGATLAGDGLVMASLLLSATVIVAQGRLLAGRDPVAVTAVQFLGAALASLPVAVVAEGAPAVPGSAGPVLAVVALAGFGTLVPFTLFAFGQSRVSAEVAGAFLNLEPLVGAIVGAVAFGDPVGVAQVAGGAAILAGIGLSSLPLLAGRRRAVAVAVAAGAGAGSLGHGCDNVTGRTSTLSQPLVPAMRRTGRNGVFVVIRGGKFGATGPGAFGAAGPDAVTGARPGPGCVRPRRAGRPGGPAGPRPRAARPGGRAAGRPPARGRGRDGRPALGEGPLTGRLSPQLYVLSR